MTARVAFVLSKFPCYDEAFLLREIHALAERLEVRIFSLRRSREPVVHDQARALLDRTLSPPYLLSKDLLRAQAWALRTRPRRWLRALAATIAGNRRSPGFLAKNLAFFPKAVLLAAWALENGVTHLHAGWATFPASAALTAAELSGLPWSFAAHAHDIYLDTTWLREKIRRAAFVTTCTAANQTHLRELAPEAAERIALVHHGLRLEDFPPSQRGSGRLELLSVGTLQPHKGFPILVDALALLAREGLDFHCTIAGGGPLEPMLRQRLSATRLVERVTLAGALTQAAVLPLYARADAFVLMAQPEWHWGIPNVIVEALAARSAVVTTRFGSVEELVRDGETGLLVPPRDTVALAAAIRRLARDPELRARLGAAGHAIVAREFDLRRAVDFYVRSFGSE